MASLNTLRTKGGWFLTIVILIALLAFILGDLGSCQGNNNPVVGEINGVKIKYTDFMHERDNQNNMLQGSGGDVSEEAYNRAWAELVTKNSFMPGFHTLGLWNTEQEKVDMTSGTYISPVIQQYFVNPQTGVFDMEMLRYFISNMTSQDHYFWQMIQKRMDEERVFSKYGVLVANGLMVNNLEVASGVAAENNVFDARFIYKPYNSIADSTINVTSAEIKEYYAKHKEKYRLEASRDIEYVVFDIIPSADDMAEGHKKADELAIEFAKAENPATWVMLNSPDDKTPPRFVREAAVENSVAAALIGNPNAVYGPVLNGETFTISRLAETRQIPDSVTFSIIGLYANETALADSLMGIANRNNFAELARNYSRDTQSAVTGGEMGTMDPTDLMHAQGNVSLAEILINTPKGGIATTSNREFIFLVNITEKTAPSTKVKIATVKYTVLASNVTHAAAMSKAQEFYNATNGSYDAFKKVSNEMSLPKRVARIRNTDRNVNGIENSVTLVHWAYSNKQGTVSQPEEISRDYIIVTALTGIIEEGIAPVEEVSSEISKLLIQRKKGDILAEQMKGTTLDQIAQEQSLEVMEADDIKFATFTLPFVGMEPRLVGAICATGETGRLSAPVKGSNGVYLFEVVNIVKEENTTEADQKIRIESMTQYLLNNLVMNSIYEKSSIKDKRVLYF